MTGKQVRINSIWAVLYASFYTLHIIKTIHSRMQTLLLRLKDEKSKQEWPTPRDWHRRRVVIAKDFLGGYCNRCRICEYRVLTFDHVPTLGTKIYEINEMCGYSDSKFTLEVLKCRLLCHNCHNIHSNHEPWP